MFRHQRLMPIVVIAGLAPAPARADELPKPTPLGDQIDILGVRIGQTPDQVHATVAKLDPGGDYREGKAVDPATKKPYVSQIQFVVRHPDPDSPGRFDLIDNLKVVFSAPTSGNVSLGVHRDVAYFRNMRPLRAKMVASLEAKYGKSPYRPAIVNANEPSETYVFDAGGALSARDPAYRQGDRCRARTPGSFSNYCGSVNLWWAMMPGFERSVDYERVGHFEIDLRDHALAMQALKLDQAAAQREKERQQPPPPGARL